MIPDASRLEKELAEVLGYKEFTAKERLIGDPYSTTRVLTFTGGGRESSIVVKNFSDVRSLKWALLGVWAAAANKFTMTPLARLEREYAVTRALRLGGVMVPAIIAVSPDVRILAKEFIEGLTLSKVIDDFLRGSGSGLESVSAYGRLLARVHGTGYALGDAKASNVIVCPRGSLPHRPGAGRPRRRRGLGPGRVRLLHGEAVDEGKGDGAGGTGILGCIRLRRRQRRCRQGEPLEVSSPLPALPHARNGEGPPGSDERLRLALSLVGRVPAVKR